MRNKGKTPKQLQGQSLKRLQEQSSKRPQKQSAKQASKQSSKRVQNRKASRSAKPFWALLKIDLQAHFYKVYNFSCFAVFFGLATLIFRNLSQSNLSVLFTNVLQIVTYITAGFTVVTTIIFIIRRFRISTYASEGYLLNTLPISASKIILEKILFAFISLIVMLAVTLTGVFLAIQNTKILTNFFYEFENFTQRYVGIIDNATAITITIAGIVILLMSLISVIYLGITIGHKSSDRKTGKSILFSFLSFILAHAIIIGIVYLIDSLDPMNYGTMQYVFRYGFQYISNTTFVFLLWTTLIGHAALIIITTSLTILSYRKGINL